MVGRLCLLLFAVASVPSTAEGSTLDLHEAVLRSPFQPQDNGDHFGYSVALHDTMDPSTRTDGMSLSERLSGARIVVGVPGGTPLNASVIAPGYVAECPLLPGDCDALRGNGMGNDRFLYDVTGNMDISYSGQSTPLTEEKSGMFLGGAMASQGDRFIVCGHRRVSDASVGTVQGMCYESGRSLSDFQLAEPCLDRDGDESARSADPFVFLNGRLTWCLGGMDATYMPDGSFVVGAPGIRRAFRGGFVFRDGSTLRSGETVDNDAEEYVGYSVAQGRVMIDGEYVILGAPRARNGDGRVYIVARVLNDADAVIVDLPAIALDNPGKIGSYFGHAVAAVDFNGDGLAEVVVASPLHFEVLDQPEIGAVHVFTHDNGSLSNDLYTALISDGIPSGRFGHALAAMGDMNFDGYEDLVVSAPFAASDSTEPGTVYVYLGSSTGVRRDAAQVIRGNQLNLMSSQLVNLRSFGAALSGTTDIDGNRYNDLVIGAYESRQVFVLRSRTVVVIETSITSSLSRISITSDSQKACMLDGIRYDCFSVDFCLTVRAKDTVSGQLFNISYSLRSDQNAGGQPRAILNNGESEMNSTVLLGSEQSRCWSEVTVYITSPDSIYQTPLRPTIIAYIPDEPRPPPSNGNIDLADLQVSRLFSRQEPPDSFVQVQGEQTCVGVCETDLQPTDVTLTLLGNDQRVYTDLFLGFVTRGELSLTLRVPQSANVEDAYGVCVNISAPTGFRYSASTGFNTCTGSSLIQCCINAPIATGGAVPVGVSFTIQSANVDMGAERNITLQGEATVGFNTVDTNLENNTFVIFIRVVPAADASISIDVTSNQLVVAGNYTRVPQESLPVNVGQLGRPFTASFSLTNLGPETIPSGRFVARVPHRTPCTTNAFLYYITDIERSGVLSSGCTVQPAEELVVDVLQLTQGGVSNTTSSLDDVPGTCALDTATVDINCTANPTWCVQIECIVTDFMISMEGRVAFSGYLDEHYFYYRTLNHFALQFEGDFIVDDAAGIEDPNPNSALRRVVLTNPNVTTAVDAIPWWAIAVPIVVAIILVIALIVALYLCGFFKRKQSWTPEEDGLTEGEEQQQGEGEGKGEEGEEGEEPVIAGEKDVPNNSELV